MSLASKLAKLVVVVLWLIMVSYSVDCVMAAEAPFIRGQSGALVDVQTGRVLWEANGSRSLPIASTTKIMTALLAVERCSLKDTVTIPPEAEAVHGSRIYLEAGETYSMEDLLYALMISSANDAAVAIAHHVSGSVKDFTHLMNQRAKELDLDGFVFRNPHGLDEEEHVGTAVDLALLGAHAMKNPLFRRFAQATSAKIPWPVKHCYRDLNTHNYFLTSYPGATGIKTGWTNRAGQCLVSSAKSGEREVVGVILGAESRSGLWTDMSALISYGLEEFEVRMIVEAGHRFDLSETTGIEGLFAIAETPVLTVRPADAESQVEPAVKVVPAEFDLPVVAGMVVGSVEVYEGGTRVGWAPLVSLSEVPFAKSASFLKRQWPWALLAVVLLMGIRSYRLRRRRKRVRRVLGNRYSPLLSKSLIEGARPKKRPRPRRFERRHRTW